VIFDEVKIHLDDKQYRNLLNIIEYMTNFDQLEQYRLFKPVSKLSVETAQKHWNFVGKLLILLNDFTVEVAKKDTMKKYFSWKGVMERRKNRNDYIELYKRKQEVPWLQKLEGDDLIKFNTIENQLSYEDIIL
jgi:vacuolar protein sorting-associated protein 13A/C